MRIALALAVLLPMSAAAQSSNSSSNCSNGNCTRLETYIPDDRREGRGWTRFDSWREGERQVRRDDDRRDPRGRDRRDRDDDDDDDRDDD